MLDMTQQRVGSWKEKDFQNGSTFTQQTSLGQTSQTSESTLSGTINKQAFRLSHVKLPFLRSEMVEHWHFHMAQLNKQMKLYYFKYVAMGPACSATGSLGKTTITVMWGQGTRRDSTAECCFLF